MAAATSFLTSLPHAQFRRSAEFYRRYDLAWLVVCASVIVGLEVAGVAPLAMRWQWWFPLLLPVVIYAHIVSNVFVHNACHASFPRAINRIVGEILGAIVLTRFASWEIVHARHHRFSDDVEKDPHPVQDDFWRFVWRSFRNVEAQLQTAYFETFGDTPENRRREKIRAFFSFATGVALVATWWRLLGHWGFWFFFAPSSILGWLFVMHFNWVTHNGAHHLPGGFRPINIDRGYYWLGNRIFFGIYMHANHHKRAGVFHPLYFKAEPGEIDPADELR
jgi:stearoyl-CoA desaturase (delta-9 desaturase)